MPVVQIFERTAPRVRTGLQLSRRRGPRGQHAAPAVRRARTNGVEAGVEAATRLPEEGVAVTEEVLDDAPERGGSEDRHDDGRKSKIAEQPCAGRCLRIWAPVGSSSGGPLGVTPARIGSAAAVLRRVVEDSIRGGADRARVPGRGDGGARSGQTDQPITPLERGAPRLASDLSAMPVDECNDHIAWSQSQVRPTVPVLPNLQRTTMERWTPARSTNIIGVRGVPAISAQVTTSKISCCSAGKGTQSPLPIADR